ncbi:hypothetical protein ONZ45_g18102 [Pleurotus djamor]|nr:hypothetical protein ONZ45_g18102 [Pleurotus djamor]
MYFGSTGYISEALADGAIHWEGIARNVEYLGLSTDIKVFLGRWYGNWLHTGRARYDPESDPADDSDTAYDSDDFGDDCSTASDMDDEDLEFDDLKTPERGRTRETRRLSSITSRDDL